MKITPEHIRLIAERINTAAQAFDSLGQLLSSLAVEPEQTELPTTGTNLGASVNLTIPPEQIQAIAKKLVEEPIEHSSEYLASKRACVEVAPEAPKPEPITLQSLRKVAEKLVAKGKLDAIKAELGKHGVTKLTSLKAEHYQAVNAVFAALLV